MYRSLLCLVYVIPLLIYAGCERPTSERHYTEIFMEAPSKPSGLPMDDPHAFMRLMPEDEIHANLNTTDAGLKERLEASVAKTPLSWNTPSGWLERPASGMRLATFINTDPQLPVETTIVALAGTSGGIEDNVVRWMGQIHLEVPDSRDLNDFIKKQERFLTDSGLTVILIDFSGRQKTMGTDVPSMIAAVIERPDSQIFVKMNGSKQAVIQNRTALKSLIRSLKVSTP